MRGPSNPDVPAELLQQIAARLRPVCSNLPDEIFTQLVKDVAKVKLKYDEEELLEIFESEAVKRQRGCDER